MSGLELQSVIQQMQQTAERLRTATREIFILAKEKAEAERNYRIELAKEIARLRFEGVQATLIPDLARGKEEIALLKFNRGITADRYRSGIEVIKGLQSELSSLQTISKYQAET